jgi:hypothetical protein
MVHPYTSYSEKKLKSKALIANGSTKASLVENLAWKDTFQRLILPGRASKNKSKVESKQQLLQSDTARSQDHQ